MESKSNARAMGMKSAITKLTFLHPLALMFFIILFNTIVICSDSDSVDGELSGEFESYVSFLSELFPFLARAMQFANAHASPTRAAMVGEIFSVNLILFFIFFISCSIFTYAARHELLKAWPTKKQANSELLFFFL